MDRLHEGVVELHGKRFERCIPYDRISETVRRVAESINRDYASKDGVVFLCVLNGAFMFAAELLRNVELRCEVSFIKLSSYNGTASTGVVSDIMGINCDLKGKHVVVVEDIVDSGRSMHHLLGELEKYRPASVAVAVLFYKPDSCLYNLPLKYCAMDMPKDFIVGFGLDYDGLGRNYKDIYRLADE